MSTPMFFLLPGSLTAACHPEKGLLPFSRTCFHPTTFTHDRGLFLLFC
jgi:hypothetical protein